MSQSFLIGNIKGPKGDTGAAGPTGPQGPQGEQGIQGEKGKAFAIAKVYSSVACRSRTVRSIYHTSKQRSIMHRRNTRATVTIRRFTKMI